MAYGKTFGKKTVLIQRPYRDPRQGISGLSGAWDDITGFFSNVGSGFATAEQAQGAQAAMMTSAQNQALMQQANQGILGGTTGTLLVVGGIGALVYFLIKK